MTVESFKTALQFRLENELARVAPSDTSNLRQQLTVKIVGEEIQVIMPDYWKYIKICRRG